MDAQISLVNRNHPELNQFMEEEAINPEVRLTFPDFDITPDELEDGALDNYVALRTPQELRNIVSTVIENSGDYVAARLMGAERKDDSNAI
ncbi:MAG: hypothetical protein DUD32_09995 [Lactobacillus sp.]|nr:MAG: hypothetical protein DUD32_09995 [Lactobacillus sp.]